MNNINLADVSVIVPVYNSENTIHRAIASVLNQTVLPREIIVVDDCSTDKTHVILEEIKAACKHVSLSVYTQKQNTGPSICGNNGWDVAKSTYIAFLDSDDAWHKNKLEVQFQYMKNNSNIDLSGHVCPQIHSLDELIIMNHKPPVKYVGKYKILVSNRFSTPSIMLKRNIPLRFDPEKRYSEDYHLWMRLILSGHSAVFINLPLAGIFKPPYGKSGLSARLWDMEKGEINAYFSLKNEKLINGLLAMTLILVSYFKYLKRLLVINTRIITNYKKSNSNK